MPRSNIIFCSDAAKEFLAVTGGKQNRHQQVVNRGPRLPIGIPKEFYDYFKSRNNPRVLLPPRLIIDIYNNDTRLPYRKINERDQSIDYMKYSGVVHIGQRKLAISEFDHLTEILRSKEEYAVVVYAGAAPTNKAWMEHLMFPNVKFLLVDPNMFNIFVKTYRDWHYLYVDHDHPEKGREGVGIVYFGNSTDNLNLRYEVEQFDIRYFDGQRVVTFKDKYAASAPNKDTIGSPGNRQAYIDYFYDSDDRIFINEHYFTNETAEFCRQLMDARNATRHYAGCKFIFWSDIRAGDMDDDGKAGDLDILWNTSMMYNWCKIIKPHCAMIKFRTPYANQDATTLNYAQHDADFSLSLKYGNDIVGHFIATGNLMFFAGEIHTQCWAPRYSGETRLWVTNFDEIIEYDRVAYEQSLYYYNIVERSAMFHENPYVKADLGFDNCGDCAIEADVWRRYKIKHDPSFDVYWWMSWLGDVTTRPLTRGGHGKLIYKRMD